ncbi:MAG TPA: SDR family NAD(P)-dependent oxidoreductase, partial [Saprospiraceae bacterium]|nr:SDR family NAD(P)-dependent oxidoreductase [Saprospiraceae bacterium]
MKRFILITGSSSGIGEYACKVLLEAGYSILAGVRSMEDFHRLREKFGSSLHPLILDVTMESTIHDAYDRCVGIVGDDSLVAIINNAGIVVHGAFLYIPSDAWHRQFDVNVYGIIRTIQSFFPLLKKSVGTDAHPHRIINISSVSGLFASPFMGPYVASKYAVEAMTDSLRRELYMYDIQVVLLEPGSIKTPMWTKAKTTPSYLGEEYEAIAKFKNSILDRNISKGIELSVLDPYLIKAIRQKKVRPRYLIRRDKWKFNLIRYLPDHWV